MSSSGKEITVGYKYYLGMHMVLCHGPVDSINRVRVDGKDAWVGDRSSGQIYINSPSLFGGESREGGVQGYLDFEAGGSAQGVNSYLQSKLGGLVPAFRGVAAVVLRQMYLGLNPYLKKWAFRIQRIHLRQNGIAQWYYPKAEIRVASRFKVRQMFYFALDTSASMDTVISGGQTRLDIAKSQLCDVLDSVDLLRIDSGVQVDICIVAWWGASSAYTEYYNVTSANITSLKSWVNARTSSSGTEFDKAFSRANSFFQYSASDSRHRCMFFITDGEPVPTSSADVAVTNYGDIINGTGNYAVNKVEVYAINIDLDNTEYTLRMDNTPQDGVPVVDSVDSTALYDAVFFAVMGDSSAMNPAHIIRECLTDPDWGMGYTDADIDDQSFMIAADQLYSESMGISVLWDRQKAIEDFIADIVRHIDAALFVSRTTGQFTLKLIRDDYIKGDLILLDEDNIDRIENFTRPAFGELVNAVTVNFWNVNSGKDASVTAQDIALQQMQGVTIGTTLQYPGFVEPNIAARVAQRDLHALSSQRATCTLYTDRTAKDLTVGSVFRLTWSDYGLDDVVMRVTSIAYGDGRNNRIRVTCSEDVFYLPTTSLVEPPSSPIWEDPSGPPALITNQKAFEAPYIELVQQMGQLDTDTKLADNPDLGYIGVAAARPSASSLSSRIFTSPDTTVFEDVGTLDYCPMAQVDGALSRFATTIPIKNDTDLDLLVVPSWAQIGDELIWVSAVTGTTSLTVIRGIYDTVPTVHSDGDLILFWDKYGAGSATEFISGETVQVRLADVAGQGQYDETAATEMEVVLAQRAYRPYRPAKLAIDGETDCGVETEVSYPFDITWVSRNRLQETGGTPLAWTDATVTAEASTTYRITLLGEAVDNTRTQFHQENVGLVLTYEVTLAGKTIPEDAVRLVVQVHTVRSTIVSATCAEFVLSLLDAPSGLTLLSDPALPPTDLSGSSVEDTL